MAARGCKLNLIMDHILLKTDRLTLRCFTDADVDNLFELDNDPEVMRFINGGTPTPYSVIKCDILPVFLHHDRRCPEFGFWAADDKISTSFQGWFSIRATNDAAEEIALGYRLRRAAWGKGYDYIPLFLSCFDIPVRLGRLF